MEETSHQKQLNLAQTLRYPLAPLKLFHQTFCQHCNNREWCWRTNHPNKEDVELCILACLTDEVARLRQTIQQRTQHLAW